MRSIRATLVRTAVAFSAFYGARAQIDLVDTAHLNSVTVFDSTLRSYHSLFVGTQGAAAIRVELASELILVNSVFVTSPSAAETLQIVDPGASLSLHGDLFPEIGKIHSGFSADAAGLAALEQCDDPTCLSAGGNALGTYVIGASPFIADAASAPLLDDSGVNPYAHGAPPSAARDFEGDCRAAPFDRGPDHF